MTKKKKNSIIGILSTILVLFSCAGCLFGCEKPDDNGDRESKKLSGYEAFVKEYFDVIRRLDPEKYLSLYPEELVDKEAEEGYDGSKAEMIGLIDDEFDMMREAFKDDSVKILKLEYKIADVVHIDAEELEELNKQFKKYDIDLIIEDSVNISTKVIVPVDGKKQDITMELQLIKANGKWCLFEDDFYALRQLLPSYVEDEDYYGYEEPEEYYEEESN